MGDETADVMNLDLNLDPVPEQGSDRVTPEAAVDLDGWMEERVVRVREAARLRARQRGRWRRVVIPSETGRISMDWNQVVINSGNSVTVQAGEGSVAPRERTDEGSKVLDNYGSGFAMDAASEEKKDDVDKTIGEDGGFFDCNICLDMARDPVVTCCGHLFCWPCLYRWIHIHSDVKECPVCKGEVTIKNVTPIYGRGNVVSEPPDEDSNVKIPPRPPARRAESFRQVVQRTSLHFPMEDVIRQLNSRSELTPALSQPPEPNDPRDVAERNSPSLNRLLTSRGLRRDRNLAMAMDDDALDNGQNDDGGSEWWDARHIHSLLLRRSLSHRNPPVLPPYSSAFSSAERVVEPRRRRGHVAGRNNNQPPPVDDQDSFSSIAAVINSESHPDTALEIDSVVSLSASTSRQRNDTAMVSNVDGSDSRTPRRRRME